MDRGKSQCPVLFGFLDARKKNPLGPIDLGGGEEEGEMADVDKVVERFRVDTAARPGSPVPAHMFIDIDQS